METPWTILVVGASSCAALAWTGWMMRWQILTRRWQRAQARVQEAWIDQVGTLDAGAWKAGVRYTFTAANGRAYRGERLSFEGGTHRRRTQAEAELAPFRPGRPIDVWYDPDDPTRSVVDRQLPWSRYAGAVIGLIGFLSAVVPLMSAALGD